MIGHSMLVELAQGLGSGLSMRLIYFSILMSHETSYQALSHFILKAGLWTGLVDWTIAETWADAQHHTSFFLLRILFVV